ncbi:hypothetical protein HOF40_04825 [Candidatus Parcubacteria bacterium]|jgi:protein-tyrosine phosphatase|nr:hypothetical protein [Candidatus Parcubacteria bacterium]MBT3949385.1 hypothetical protein [Candidatus Parcubacteria bacterium]
MTKIKFPFIKHDEAHPIFEYDKIDDYILIGTNMCCQTHFDEELLDQEVNADISLEEERLDAAQGVKYFLWLPTADHTPSTQEQLKVGVDMIDSLVRQKIRMYIHCKNGHGRAPTLVSAYYIAQGLSVEEAIKKIQDKRSVIHLDQNQIDALDQFKKNFS